MGIRELAAEAKVADEAHKKSETKRIWAVNARRGETTVYNLLGVEGTGHRANNAEEKEHGDGTTVRLEDDLYVQVTVRNEYGPRPYYGEAQVIGQKVYLMLADEKGSTLVGGLDHQITSLATLHDALNAVEKYEAELAVRAARKAATAKA